MKYFFILLYYFVLLLFFIVALPFLIFFSFKKKYKYSIPARFFLWKNSSFKKNSFWLHGCSLGEIHSFEPLILKLNKPINLTTTTQTGFSKALSLSNEVKYLPFEVWLPFWIKKPKALIVTEAELWPLLFITCKLKGAKTYLINARISDKSYIKYKKFAFFYKILFSYIDTVFAQTVQDKIRLKELGAQNIVVNGNIKTALKPNITNIYKKPQKKLLTLASSHEKEEELILQALQNLENIMIAVAPRHPERFQKVDILLQAYTKKYNLHYEKFSKKGFVECDILLIDTLGELVNIYNTTDITLLCGSFIEGIGGHNPIEPAFFNNVIISGEYFHNQKELYLQVENIHVVKIEELRQTINTALPPSRLKEKDALTPILKELQTI